ncbi:importin-alpha re-exporter [Protomyces lactucae-debilis]|uniref:Importin-alpha re-exporter n=1 Tax=Protomyces lactucae-debilis TaxID=2754530 RepID=A0A1Y2FPM0_PROLT|nr:importin-alpha re-exporter [Protomyces lactucae-debilis]ORY85547.1 importin-alpha re-exporter [Protomyces lactucae-debilis]
MSAEVAALLRQSFDPSTSKQAEERLRQAETQSGFASVLLEIVASTSIDLPTRQAASLFFKNYVKRNWEDDEEGQKIALSDRQLVKDNIVSFMTRMPPTLQVQVGEAVTLIADTDFPAKWDYLIDSLISQISLTDMSVTNGVLQTAHSIFKRWRSQFRSDALFTEINFVLSRFCEPFLAIFKQTDLMIDQNRNNKQALDILLQTLLLLTKVFYDLNCQDIPEFFEDHMAEFMSVLHKYLTIDLPVITAGEDDDVAGPLQKVKASICEIVELYTQRYEEIFTMLPEFVNTTWVLLTQVSLEPKDDILVSKALSSLTSVVRVPRHAQLFESEEVLKKFVELIVLPNMSLRTSDEELFEDDPIEYIRRDLEGSDSDTRRRAATEFVRSLVEKFEQKITSIVLEYVKVYLTQYAADPVSNWKSKDTAMYLISSIAVKGSTTKFGVSSTNIMVDVVEFFNVNVLGDLHAGFSERHPITKVDAIKFIHTFRNQLTKQQITSVFPMLAQHLTSPNYVVYTYAAVTVEALLTMKRDGQTLFSTLDVAPFSAELLQNLLSLIERGSSPEKLAENDFLMRCAMRVVISAQEGIATATEVTVHHLNKILAEISKNPSNPKFNHYFFECYGAVIKYVGAISKEALAQLEAMLTSPLLMILQNDTTEFIPYAFQLLAEMLEMHDTKEDLPLAYKQLLQPILTPTLWDSRGNIPALVRLLQAFVVQGPSHLVSEKLLEPVLGIYQKLIASRANDGFGFDLVESLFACVPLQALEPYAQQIFVLPLTRLSGASKTEKLASRFALFLATCASTQQLGPDFAPSILERIQPGLFAQLMRSIVLPHTSQLASPSATTKRASCGFGRMLASCSMLKQDQALWLQTLTTCLKLLELPAGAVLSDAGSLLQQQQEEETMADAALMALDEGFQASFAKLVCSAPLGTANQAYLALAQLQGSTNVDPRRFLATCLNEQLEGRDTWLALVKQQAAETVPVLQSYGLNI